MLQFCEKVRENSLGTLMKKNVCDNKKCWYVVKPLLPNKVVSNVIVALAEYGNSADNEKETTTPLNNFFSNIQKQPLRGVLRKKCSENM